MKRNNIIKSILFSSTLLLGVSCTNLDEEILDGYNADATSGGNINSTAILQSAIEGLRRFQEQGEMFTMGEMSTDALVGPTRGGDWDDNAKWRQFHVHTWGPDNTEIVIAWNDLLSNVYSCNQVVENSSDASQVSQARFLRAFYYYNAIDLFGQVPYREAGSSLEDDAKVWTRSEATTFVISELEAIVASLPARTANDPSIVNKDAANFLLAKLYLNKAVFNATDLAGPYVFDAADMNKVVSYVDAISSSLAPDYWDNFAPANNTSPELLFTSKNTHLAGGGIQSRWKMGMHYNQTPGGWNGFATVAEYYNRFDAADKRRNKTSPLIIANLGNPIGFQIGQMYAPGGVTPLKDRNGNPLIYTPALTLVISDATAIETGGIRTQKYEPDLVLNIETNKLEVTDKPDNDYVLMRYSDALLMKAEAIKRGATGDADAIMTEIALRAGIPAVSATLESIYAERGRELWFEGWRRNDMIRFGKFLEPRELKPGVSDSKYLIFPIPADALFNKNFKQNPGY